MSPHPLHPGIDVGRSIQPDGSLAETFTVRWKEPDGRKPRRTFDTLQDALDYKAKRRSAKRWRPEELRQEHAGRTTLAEFFPGVEHALGAALSGIDTIYAIEHVNAYNADVASPVEVQEFLEKHGALPGFAAGT